MASILSTDYPSVEGTALKIELANETMKTDVERDPGLMNYLRKAVKNYELTLEIEVNEEAATRRAYTPQEKYEKLREKNPLLDTLKDTFDLEL